jgi:hypothetical protein
MSDRAKITIGLVLFILFVSFPIWRGLGAAAPAPPDLPKPTGATSCVEGTEWMAANHQQLLDHWRDAVVREGKVTHTSTDGTVHEMSLQRSCLKCHGNRQAFCDRCHDYADVRLTCWNCHLDSSPEATRK